MGQAQQSRPKWHGLWQHNLLSSWCKLHLVHTVNTTYHTRDFWPHPLAFSMLTCLPLDNSVHFLWLGYHVYHTAWWVSLCQIRQICCCCTVSEFCSVLVCHELVPKPRPVKTFLLKIFLFQSCFFTCFQSLIFLQFDSLKKKKKKDISEAMFGH